MDRFIGNDFPREAVRSGSYARVERLEMIDPELLKVLGNPLEPDRPPFREEGAYLVCTKTGVGFPIVDGVPHLLPEDVIPADKLRELLGVGGRLD